jgi:mono/diheme cytochrome c family protein
MPAFEGALTDAQLGDLLAYLRSTTGKPAWQDAEVSASERDRK